MSQTAGSLRVLSVMAHQDDFEFNLGGAFALLRRTWGDAVALRILTTSTGQSGHHEMPPDETFARRCAEASESAALVGADYQCLRQLDGSHAAQVIVSRNLLGGLWNAIRAFRADVIFCPPVATDPLAGVHIDHDQTAWAVRYVAYQLSVPHAYPTLEQPVDKTYRTPLIINVDDPYIGSTQADIRQDIRAVYDQKLRMSLCHRSQVLEWLPWVGDWSEEVTPEKWAERFRLRHQEVNRRYGLTDDIPSECFRITWWGRKPHPGELERLFPAAM